MVNAVTTAKNLFAHSQRLCHFDNIRADIFYLLAILCFDGNESVRDQATEIERDLRAIAIVRRDRLAILARPIQLARLGEGGKEFARGWDRDFVCGDCLAELLWRETPFLHT